MFIFLVRKRIQRCRAGIDGFGIGLRARSARWALFGRLAIFCMWAEVAIASIMINFLVEINFIDHLARNGVLDAMAGVGLIDLARPQEEIAGRVLGLWYWGGAMVGRFIGSALLTRMPAGLLLSIAAAAAGALCLYVTLGEAPGAGFAALSVGLFNSIMFPTIFTLTLSRSSAPVSATSGLLCMSSWAGRSCRWPWAPPPTASVKAPPLSFR